MPTLLLEAPKNRVQQQQAQQALIRMVQQAYPQVLLLDVSEDLDPWSTETVMPRPIHRFKYICRCVSLCQTALKLRASNMWLNSLFRFTSREGHTMSVPARTARSGHRNVLSVCVI